MKNFLLKADYLNSLNFLDKIGIADIFENISYDEFIANKDSAEFSDAELRAAVKKYTDSTNTDFTFVLESLMKYRDWYKERIQYFTNPKQLELYYEHKGNLAEFQFIELKEANPDRYIDIKELISYCERIDSIYDKMFILAIYEGFDFSEDGIDILHIELTDCDDKNNIVTFPSGKKMKVSSLLMQYMRKCAATSVDELIKNKALPIQMLKRLDKNDQRCFKQILPTEDVGKIESAIKNRFRRLKMELGVEKFSHINLFYSGYIYAQLQTGLGKDVQYFSSLDTPERKENAQRYGLDKRRPYNYNVTMKTFFRS